MYRGRACDARRPDHGRRWCALRGSTRSSSCSPARGRCRWGPRRSSTRRLRSRSRAAIQLPEGEGVRVTRGPARSAPRADRVRRGSGDRVIPRPENPLVVALDVSDPTRADALASALARHVGMFKVGLELFSAARSGRRCSASRAHGPVFLDLKLHDIPNTVERASANVGRRGVRMFNVHALGGEAMIAAAGRGADRARARRVIRPRSSSPSPCCRASSGRGSRRRPRSRSRRRAAGCDGVVVSGEDVRTCARSSATSSVSSFRGSVRRVERARSGSRPDAGGGGRTRRRLPRRRSPDHRRGRSRGRRARDPRETR